MEVYKIDKCSLHGGDYIINITIRFSKEKLKELKLNSKDQIEKHLLDKLFPEKKKN